MGRAAATTAISITYNKRPRRVCLALLLAAWCLPPVLAAPIIAQGSAPLDAGVSVAREMAIQDALHQAALSQGARIDSAQYMNSGMVSESASLSAEPVSGKVVVLDEHADDGLYQVRIRLEPDPPRSNKSQNTCNTDGRSLRRRMVTANFTVDHPGDASDLDSLGIQLAQELARRLGQLDGRGFSVQDVGNIAVLPDHQQTSPAEGSAAARQLASNKNVQFVVAGRVVSTAVVKREPRLSFFGSTTTSQQGFYYNGPGSELLGPGLIYRPVARQFEMDIWVYDGLTGALLINRRLSDVAHGDVVPSRPVLFATAAFWGTDYGETVDQVLDRAVKTITGTLACLPYSARVLRVDGNRQVYLDAGVMDGMQPGDKLLLYRQRTADQIQDPASGKNLGLPETLLGDVTVIQVQPELSVAVSQSSNKLAVQAGDLVRFVPKR